MKKLIGRLVLKMFRTEMVGEPPLGKTCVLVCAPHTSNWDFVLMLAMAWSTGLDPVWLGKQEMFREPFGWIFRKMGGIPVDRDNPGALIDDIVRESKTKESMSIVIPVEGTRGKREYWKSGFRRIAMAADVPLVLAYVGGPDNTCGFGPTLPVTHDVVADMDLIREFYTDKAGVKPENFTPPLLREETEASVTQ